MTLIVWIGTQQICPRITVHHGYLFLLGFLVPTKSDGFHRLQNVRTLDVEIFSCVDLTPDMLPSISSNFLEVMWKIHNQNFKLTHIYGPW